VSEPAAPATIGVVGAGTMGAGIAQLACLSGARTLLHDPVPEALERGLAKIPEDLAKGAARGRWSEEEAQAAAARLEAAESLDAFGPCELVIEAAPESLDLKRQLFASLAGIVGDDCVLATNTSSLQVTALAAGVPNPGRVVGMHFFNPAPLMALVEVVAGAKSEERALAVVRAAGEAMGKRVIDATDGPGFLVNRCNRPFGLEALRLAQEGIASPEEVDRICRLEGGFRMGPFELMDLVGIDVGFAVSESFYEQSFGEPRWRPSPLAARQAASGDVGRKSGRGWYDYSDGPHRKDDPPPPEKGDGEGLVVVAGSVPLAGELTAVAQQAGWQTSDELGDEEPFLVVDCGGSPQDADSAEPAPLVGGPSGLPVAILCAEGSLAALDPTGEAVGFHVLPPLEEAALVELTGSRDSGAGRTAEHFFTTLGKHTAWVGDAPGLVLGRIVCQIVNESLFALGERVGSAEDIDAGMVLGMNHPRGPFQWGAAIGWDHVLSVLDALADEYREDRYRAAPLLRRAVASGTTPHV
jgi:3-hydroxybutyryl-CoA dehydrogenase